MKKSHKFLSFLLYITLYGHINFSSAEENDIRYYDVELIIFENLKPHYKESEFWSKSYTQNEPEIFIHISEPFEFDFSKPYLPQYTFQYIENTNYKLNDIVTNLNESKQYKVLLHSAWRQPGMSKTEAIDVKINHIIPAYSEQKITKLNQNNNQIENYFNQESNNDVNEISNYFNIEQHETEPGFKLYGYVKLILSRYLHLKVDLIYQKVESDVTEQFIINEYDETIELPDAYHLTQTRRLRSNELHYIDHPVISIITIITPFKVPESELILETEIETETESATEIKQF